MRTDKSQPDKMVAENLRRELDVWKREFRKRGEKPPSQGEIGHRLGMTQGAVSQYLNAKIPINTDAVLRWSNLLNVAPQKIDPNFPYKLPEESSLHNLERGELATQTVPLIPWERAAEWAYAAEPSKTLTGEEERKKVTVKVGPRAYALRVRGDLMEPIFPDGSFIIVDPDMPISNEKYVVVQLEGESEPMFKQLVIDGGKRYLKPLNPRYGIVEMTHRTKICGVVRQMGMEFD